jgi:hypothetical protein
VLAKRGRGSPHGDVGAVGEGDDGDDLVGLGSIQDVGEE